MYRTIPREEFLEAYQSVLEEGGTIDDLAARFPGRSNNSLMSRISQLIKAGHISTRLKSKHQRKMSLDTFYDAYMQALSTRTTKMDFCATLGIGKTTLDKYKGYILKERGIYLRPLIHRSHGDAVRLTVEGNIAHDWLVEQEKRQERG